MSGQVVTQHRLFTCVSPRFSDEVCNYILAEVGNGRSVHAICKEPGMPGAGTVAAWCLKDPQFAKRYLFARRKRALLYAEEIMDLSDDNEADDKVRIMRAQVQIRTRQWMIQRDLPELFGEFNEREKKPLEIHNSQNAIEYEQLSNDPIEAAKEYAKIMNVTVVANAASEYRIIAEDGSDISDNEEEIEQAIQPSQVIDREIECEVDPDQTLLPQAQLHSYYDQDRPKFVDDKLDPTFFNPDDENQIADHSILPDTY